MQQNRIAAAGVAPSCCRAVAMLVRCLAVGWVLTGAESRAANSAVAALEPRVLSHAAAENQRLQLLFRHGEIERFSAGEAPLDSFLVDDPLWVTSETAIGAGFGAMRAILPAGIFGCAPSRQADGSSGRFAATTAIIRSHPFSPRRRR